MNAGVIEDILAAPPELEGGRHPDLCKRVLQLEANGMLYSEYVAASHKTYCSVCSVITESQKNFSL